MIPFDSQTFFALLGDINLTYWPAILSAMGGALVLLFIARLQTPIASRLVLLFLSAGWAWSGFVFYGVFLSTLVWASWVFEYVCYAQAGLFAVCALLPHPPTLSLRADNTGWAAASTVAFCAIFYPLIAAQVGHAWPGAQLLGITPGPLAAATLGLLCLTEVRYRLVLGVVPALTLLITLYLALNLAIWEDLILVAIGLGGFAWSLIAVRRNAAPDASG
ncbi:MAG: DUF6064 family protein [Pseudomonadota bacterium]